MARAIERMTYQGKMVDGTMIDGTPDKRMIKKMFG
jgi:hypothetical protein